MKTPFTDFIGTSIDNLNRNYQKTSTGTVSEDEEIYFDNSIDSDNNPDPDPAFYNEQENFVPDMSKAVRLNAFYAQSLGWDQYYDKINDFLLPFSGMENVSLSPEAFAEAVSVWQFQQGFSAKNADGIIGPNTWKKLKTIIFSTSKTMVVPNQTPAKAQTSSTSCEGLYCWAKTVLNSRLSINLPLNNNFDEATKQAIGEFQVKYNLSQTKKIDPATERALLEWEAIRKQKGTAGESAAVHIISSAKTKIEDWTTQGKEGVKAKPKYILENFRDPRTLWAFVLHHMAFKRKGRISKKYSDPTAYLNTGAHFCIMLDGRIIQLHPISRMIWHGNCLSPRSVAVEFEGNFPDIKGRWWFDRTKYKRSPDEDHPTQAQFDSGRFLASYLKKVLDTKSIHPHRQSSATRENDPGPDIWYNVGQWAIDNLALTDGGPAFKCGTGNPILSQWKTWGDKVSTLNIKENAGVEEEMDWEDTETESRNYEHITEEQENETVEFEDEDLCYDEMGEEKVIEDTEFFNEQENFVPDLSKAVSLNAYYAQSLGWDQYYDQINDFLLPYSGLENVSLGPEAFAEAVSAWQFQQGFSAKDADGIIGPNTWKKLKTIILSSTKRPPASKPKTPTKTPTSSGTEKYIFSKYPLSTTKIRIQKQDVKKGYAEIWESPAVFLTEIVKKAGEDPKLFFERFTRITFLGRKLNGNQYIQEYFAKHLKKLEKELASQFGGPDSDPYIAGNKLMLTSEGMSGSRLVSSTATFSYHMLGLALDINYKGSPYIQAHDAFNAFMGKVAKLVANTDTPGIKWGTLGTKSTLTQYLKLYDDYSVLNNYLKKYFSLLETQNESLLATLISQSTFDIWNSISVSKAKALIKKDLVNIAKAWKGNRSNPEDIFKNGFLGVSREFVKVMVESGLDWGGRYGDIMHFDMRRTPGVGANIESAKLWYMNLLKLRDNELFLQPENKDFPDINDEHEYTENYVPDMLKAVRLNAYYAKSLKWNQYHDKINDLLLPFSGLQNVSLGEEAFAEAVSVWQINNGFTGKNADGVIGPVTWAKMRPFILTGADIRQTPIVTSPSTSGIESVQSPNTLGKLMVDTNIPELSKSYPDYQFTSDDALWLARFVEGEAGGQDNPDSHAVIWTMFNRFGIVRHRVPSWSSFSVFLQKYSTTLQPYLNSVGAAQRVWDNHKRNPDKYPVDSIDEKYPGTNIKRVQYRRQTILQQKRWDDFDVNTRNMVTGILNGKIPNPGIGIATHFLSTYVLLLANLRKQGKYKKPSKEEWLQYTLQFARNKKLVWIGEKPNLNQHKNAFFIQPEFKTVPYDAVKIETGIENEAPDYDLRNEPEYLEAMHEESIEEYLSENNF